jgi:hypothetical protein
MAHGMKRYHYSVSERARHIARRLRARIFDRSRYALLQYRRTSVSPEGYSYGAFDKNRCIFVHIPKCAGVSISKTLFGNLAGGHADISTYQIVFSPKEFEDYFKFTIVRNPWDRLVSAFLFLTSGGMNERDKRWADEHISQYKTFQDFVLQWLNPDSMKLSAHFRPQCHFICLGRQNVAVDFVGRYENLEADFAYICKQLNVYATLERLNSTSLKRNDFREYYTDETRLRVSQLYADDIRMLGYSFDS